MNAPSDRTRRVHIVGCHRSGTTLLAQLMWYGFRFDARAEHEASLFDPIPRGVATYLSKKPPDTIRIDRVFVRDPDLFVIAMIRDPRDVITSRHPRKPDVYFSSFWRWERYLHAIQSKQGHSRYLVLRYEELLADPDRTQMRIARQFSFLQRARAFSDFPAGAEISTKAQVSLNGIRRIDEGARKRWRAELPRLKAELVRHPSLVHWLIRLGYERDDEWTRCLEPVEPFFQSYKRKAPPALRRAETWLRYALKDVRYLRQRKLALF